MSCSANQLRRAPSCVGVRAHPRERRLRRLLHHVAELAGDRQLALARVGGRLDEEDVAADGRPGEPGRDARVGGALARVGREAARPEPRRAACSASIATVSALPSATSRAALRQRSAISRSRLRTPASRVYSRITTRSASSPISSCSSSRPCASSCFGTRYSLRDLELLLLGVARELDHVHAVEQRAGDRVEQVGGADEEHLREVERQVEVVVAEVRVLLRVEHLEQRARRVAAEVGAHLVDLVEQKHRVVRLGVAQRADDRAGHRADVGAAVAADLGLVAHAAERDAHELAAERARDRLAERGLADAGRADEAEDRAREVVLQLRTARYSRMRSLTFSRP